MQDQVTHAREDDGRSQGGSPLQAAWASLDQLHRGIGLRLLVRVLLFSSAVTLTLTLLQLYIDYRRDVGAIDHRISDIERSYRRSLGEGLWNLDRRQLDLQVDGIVHLPDIRFVEVREATDRAEPMVVTAGTRQAKADVHQEFPISYTYRGAEQRLGVLSIEATHDDVYRRLLDTAIVLLLSQGAKTFIVSFFILFLVHRLITRHLVATADFLGSYDIRRSPPPLRLDRNPPRPPDELDQLVQAFNGMSATLLTTYGELRESERRNRELQNDIAHANRIATIGQFTISIAHEVSQPIVGMALSARAALRWLAKETPDLESARRSLERLIGDANRTGDIIGRMRELIKTSPRRQDKFQINDAIRDVLALTRTEATKNGVSVKTQFAEALPLVEGDRVGLQQVLVNLINNAIEVMSGTDAGPRELLVATAPNSPDGVLVTVRDSGPGLDADGAERVFEPFYTTKPGGLGMGLVICRSIIEACGGRLWAKANEPRGAVFQFTVPSNPGETGLATLGKQRDQGAAFAPDPAEHKRVEAEARERAQLLDLTHDTIFVRNMDDVITFWNRGAEELYGWTSEQAVGMVTHALLQTVFPAPLDEIDAEVMRTGRWEGELVHKKRDGSQVVVASRWALRRDEQGNPSAILETNNDITERKRAEEKASESERRYREVQSEMAHANRVATMGQLTASIAHEVNQPIAGISASGRAALRWLAKEPPDIEAARRSIDRLIGDAGRAGHVLHRIRALVKKAPPRRDRLDVNEAIREVVELTAGEAAKNGVSVRTRLARDLPRVEGDRVELQQVMLNLVMNAVEVMSEADEGPRELLVSTTRESPDGVLVAVRDTGRGLDPANLERVFEAFYTTKSEGMGMGLAICRTIIEAHGGRLWASPNEPRGAVFQFTVPSKRDGADPAA